MPTNLPQRAEDQSKTSGRLNGRKVLFLFCSFFGVIFAMNGLFMFFAFSTFGGVDAAGAYRANFLLTKDISAAARQNDLGWSVNGAVERDKDDRARIQVIAKDRNGKPVHIKSLKAELRRPTDKRLDGEITMRQVAPNRFTGSAKKVSPGQWDFIITIRDVSGERFHSRNRIVLK